MDKEIDVIQVDNLDKGFWSPVIKDATFSIKKGSFTALLGKNGSGKSTILNILMGYISPDKGKVSILGRDLTEDLGELKNRIGLVSENILFNYPGSIHSFFQKAGFFFKTFNLSLIEKMAADLKIDLDKSFAQYSRGQKMQLVLMYTLAHSPEILLIDEITSVLDAYARNYFMQELKEFCKMGGTVVMTTNIVSEVQSLCTHVVFLNQQKVVFSSSLSSLSHEIRKVRVKSLTLDEAKKYGLKYLATNSDGSQSFVADKGFEIVHPFEEDRRSISLEEIYVFYSQKDIHA